MALNRYGFFDSPKDEAESAAISAANRSAYGVAGGDPAMFVDYEKFKDDPADVTGQLLRNQYTDYMNRYRGAEDSLMAMTTYQNPELVNQEIQQAIGSGGYVRKALNTAEGIQQRSAARFGAIQDADTQQAVARSNDLNRSMAVVDAANRIRQRLATRNQQIAVGTVPNAGRAYGLSSEVKGGE